MTAHMPMQTSRKATLSAVGVLMLCSAPGGLVFAGPLADFEKVATQQNDSPRVQARGGDAENDYDDYWPLVVLDIVGDVVAYGGQLSLSRVRSDPEFAGTEPRELGSANLPFLRVDLAHQDLGSDVQAFDGRVEAGYGPAGLQYRLTRMRQGATQEALDVSYLHGLYRVSGSDAFEIGIGLGQISLEGEAHHSGSSMTLPLAIYPLRELGIRLVPTWSDINGNTIRDYEGSVAYVQKYFSIALGYRQIQSYAEKLRGPYAGVSFHY